MSLKVLLIAVIGVSLACCASIGKDDRSPTAKSKRAIYVTGDVESTGGRGGDALLDGPAGDGAFDIVGGAGGEGLVILRGRVTGKVRSVGGAGGHASVRNYLKNVHKFKGKKRIVGGTGNVGLVIGSQDGGDDDEEEEEEDVEVERRRRDLRDQQGGSRKKRDVIIGVGEDGEGYEVRRRPGGGTLVVGGHGGDGLVIKGGTRQRGNAIFYDDVTPLLVGKSSNSSQEEAGKPSGRRKRQAEFYVRQFKTASLHKAVLVQEVFARQAGNGPLTVLAEGTVRLGDDGVSVDGKVFVNAGSSYGGDVQRWEDNFLNKWGNFRVNFIRTRRRRRELREVEEDDDEDDDVPVLSLGNDGRVSLNRRNKKKNRHQTIQIRGGNGAKGLVIRGNVDGVITAVGGAGGDVTLGEEDSGTKRGRKPSGSGGKRPSDDGFSYSTFEGSEDEGTDDNSRGSGVSITTGNKRGGKPSGRRPGDDGFSYSIFEDSEDDGIDDNSRGSGGSGVRITTGNKRGGKPSGSDGKRPGEDGSSYSIFEDGEGGKTIITEVSSKGPAGGHVRIGTGGKLAVSSDGKKSSARDEIYLVRSTPSPKRTPPGGDYADTAFF
ncbi:unnamed protein product [Phyllotreta striolata]|uniref:Uncharacterized protein n=1 Tax=Phyllotreta striolata TaxID=444603 RepID=A0A9N9TJZ3_PHYSR|nr:unnamed protein product [Phyllotreta striolata]